MKLFIEDIIMNVNFISHISNISVFSLFSIISSVTAAFLFSFVSGIIRITVPGKQTMAEFNG